MKKILAIILSVVMLFGVLAINISATDDAVPTVTIITNEGSAVEQGTTTYFTVKFSNFAAIKGVDVTITADKAITLGAVEAYGFKNAASKEGSNINYTESNVGEFHTIRFADLTTAANARIVFEAKVEEDVVVTGDPKINVTGKYADSGETFLDVDAPAAGTFELKKEVEAESANVVTEEDKNIYLDQVDTTKKFVPYGGVYTTINGEYVYAEKNEDGTFSAQDALGEYKYQSYDIPTNGITTFGASNDLKNKEAIRFGSYSENYVEGVTKHGTVVFEGDWLILKNYYIKKGYTVQEFVKAIYDNATATLAKPENENKTFVTYTLSGKKINVYIFWQKNYMWKDKNNGILEYAIRLQNMQPNTTYTAVGFSSNPETNVITFSEDVKSVTK